MAVTLSLETDEFWRTEVAPALNLSPEVSLTEPDQGFATRVYFVQLPDGNQFSLRLYPRRNSPRMKNYLQANRFLSELGHRVPRIQGTGQTSRRSWVLEERIPGESFRDLLDSPEAVGKAAAALARLHSTQRNRYGEVTSWGGFRLNLRWRQRFAERWAKVTRLFPEAKTLTEQVSRWFADWADHFEPGSYQLLHGDYHPGNLCLTRKGEVAFFDLRTPRFGLGLLELIEAAHHFCGEEATDWQPFVSVYLRDTGSEVRERFEKQGVDLHAVFHLRHADRFADLAIGQRGEIGDRRRWERNAWDSLARFLQFAGLETPPTEVCRESAFTPVPAPKCSPRQEY
jgi:aminoglycoside phosphotransferase (APT) family kinase protein